MCLVVAYYVMNPVPWAGLRHGGVQNVILVNSSSVKCDCGFKKTSLFHSIESSALRPHLWHSPYYHCCTAGVYNLIGTSLCVLLSARKKLTHSGDFSSGVSSSNSRRRTSPSVKNKQRNFQLLRLSKFGSVMSIGFFWFRV